VLLAIDLASPLLPFPATAQPVDSSLHRIAAGFLTNLLQVVVLLNKSSLSTRFVDNSVHVPRIGVRKARGMAFIGTLAKKTPKQAIPNQSIT